MLKLKHEDIGLVLGYMFSGYKDKLRLQMELYDWIYLMEKNGIPQDLCLHDYMLQILLTGIICRIVWDDIEMI